MKKIISVFISILLLCRVNALWAYADGPERKTVALTFDDGPHYKYTDTILEILDKYGVTATFFIIGVNAEKYPEKVKKCLLMGHEIGNHTYLHKPYREGISGDIDKCGRVLMDISGREIKLFRPPEGRVTRDIKEYCKVNGLDMVLWDIDTEDWRHTPSEVIADRVIKEVRPGDIILMHDFISGSSPTPKALEIFIPRLIEMGYTFVTVSEIISAAQ